MGALYGGLRACRCERPNVSPSLGTDKKFRWPVDSSYLESHHLLYFIPPVDTKSWQDTYKKLLKQKRWKLNLHKKKAWYSIPTCFLQQCWILWSIKALKWLSGSCGGFGTLAKAWFAWNMDRSLGARAQPAFLSIYLKLQKHHDDQSIQGEIISNGRFVFDFSFLWQRGQKFLYSVFVCFSVSGQFLLMVDSQLLLNFRPRLQV